MVDAPVRALVPRPRVDRRFRVDGPFREQWRHVPTRANGQPAVGCYMWDAERGAYVDVLTLRGTRISEVTGFVDREVFARFALPNQLPVQRALSSAASPGLQSKQLD